MIGNKIIYGDCNEVLDGFRTNSINLIMTSPPYADKRGGPPSGDYVNWFLPISKQLLRVLKKNGSFILNIKEGSRNYEKQTYVLELILALKKQGWFWIEEYCWHKKNSFPGKWPNRFRDSWERCLHFTKSKNFKMYQENVMVPPSNATKKRLETLCVNDYTRLTNATRSGMSVKRTNWSSREFVYPTNVLHVSTECGNKGHSATYPIQLPTWFIKLFSKPDDIVLDPFVGSGTTSVAAQYLNRRWIGIEIDKQNYNVAERNLKISSKITNSSNDICEPAKN